MSSTDDEEEQIRELEEIKKYVDEQKASGNRMFVSGWDDDTEDIETEPNPHSKYLPTYRYYVI